MKHIKLKQFILIVISSIILTYLHKSYDGVYKDELMCLIGIVLGAVWMFLEIQSGEYFK